MTTLQGRNEAAEGLILERPGDEEWRFRISAALGIERRATVERIKGRLRGFYSIAPSSDDLAIYGLRLSTIEAILDEEAE